MERMIRIAILTLLCGLAVSTASAQGVNDVRINEVLVNNENGLIDEFGVHAPWLELYNSGYERINVNGCIIRVNYTDGSEKRFVIPQDKNTQLAPLSYLVLYFNNPSEPNTSRTNFHTGLSLENAKNIEIYQASGKDLIDAFVIPSDAEADVSYGHISTQEGIVALDNATPGSSNEVVSLTPRHEIFRQRDPWGGMMSLVAMSVVFCALVLIFIVLRYFGKFMIARGLSGGHEEETDVEVLSTTESLDSEIASVIGTAIHLYQSDSHDKESYVITIDPSFEHTSWSFKGYEMTESNVK